MALETSILKSVKKVLGLPEGYDAFDQDTLMHINSAFFTLTQIGLGPADGFFLEGDDAKWGDFDQGRMSKSSIHAVKTYVVLYVRTIFDPPQTPHHIQAIKEQKEELLHRLSTERELTPWTR